jgi:hypothetical protein
MDPKLFQLAAAGCAAITCTCGHIADLDAFCRTEIAGELPAGHYQCPSCHRAWRIAKGKVVITPWHTVISDPNQIVLEQTQL